MIPAAFLLLDAFPLNSNGKIDRRALPAPSDARPVARRYVDPRGPLDALIAQVWEDLLDVRPIGIRDNFFDIGGHSLLAVRMVKKLEEVSGQRLPLSALFAGATIEQLASVLVQQGAETFRTPFTVFQAGGSRVPFFFLHGDYFGGGFYCRNLARHLGPDQPFYALHPHGLDSRPVPQTIEAMADDHLRTLRALRPEGPYLLGGHCNGGLVAFEMARRLQAQGRRVDLLVLVDASARNARFRALQQFAIWLGSTRGYGPAEQQTLFLGMRQSVMAREERLQYYATRLREVLRSGVDEQVAFIRRQLRRRGAHLLSLMTRSRHQGQADRTGRPTATAAGGLTELDKVYHRAGASYVPRPYSGRVTLFRSGEDLGTQDDRGWRRVAREVEVHPVPGRHSTSITQYAQVVAEELRACLRDLQMF